MDVPSKAGKLNMVRSGVVYQDVAGWRQIFTGLMYYRTDGEHHQTCYVYPFVTVVCDEHFSTTALELI